LNKVNYKIPDHRLAVETIKEARAPVVEKVAEACRAYGESSHSLATFIPALNQVFPDCRFIYLTRDGRSYLKSAIQWGVYTVWSQDYINYCWTPKPDDPHYGRFNDYNVFQKNCWIWSAYNEAIINGLTAIPGERLYHLKMEELSAEKIRGLFDWLGFDDFDSSCSESMLKVKVNCSKADAQVPDFAEWSQEWLTEFNRIAGPTMEKLGYDNSKIPVSCAPSQLKAIPVDRRRQ